MNVKDVAVATVFAAMYVGLCLGLAPISYEAIQVRVADALYPLIGLFGWPAFYGLLVGHFIANIFSPLGVIDLLSVVMFLPAKLAILKWKLKAVPLHVLSVALWVAYMLHYLFGLPYWLTALYVGIGESIAEIGLGFPLFYAIKKRMIKKCVAKSKCQSSH